MNYQTIETQLAPGVALIWLNRPDVRNAMNDTMIAELTDAFEAAIEDDAIRAIVLAGKGKAFCAGGDLNWMKRAGEMSPEEAFEDSRKLARLLRKQGRSPLLVAADVYRPAAMDQLATLGKQLDLPVFVKPGEKDVLRIGREAGDKND